MYSFVSLRNCKFQLCDIFSFLLIEHWLETKAIYCDIHILVIAKFVVVIDNAEGWH